MDARIDGGARKQRRTLLGVAMGAAIWGALASLLLRTDVPALNLPQLDSASYFSPAELARIHEFRAVTRWFWVSSTLIELGVLALLAWRGRWLAFVVRRGLRLPPAALVRCGAAVAACCSFAVWFATLPVGVVRHWWYRRYALTEQGYVAWAGDQALALLVTTVGVVLAVGLAVYLAVRLGRRWWLVGSAAIAVLGSLAVLAQPLVVEPLFNRFTPISDRNLAARIETLGHRLGVGVESVDVSDASRRTTTVNASVTGIGPTRHVVLYDTLLDGRFTEGEILWVSAHELAHVARSHVWKGVAWFVLFAIPGLAAIAWVTERTRGPPRPGGRSAGPGVRVRTLGVDVARTELDLTPLRDGSRLDRAAHHGRSGESNLDAAAVRAHGARRSRPAGMGADRPRLASDHDAADRDGEGGRGR